MRELQIPQVNPDTKASKFVYNVEVTVWTQHPDELPTSDQVQDLVHSSLQYADSIVRHVTAQSGWDTSVQVTNEPNIDAVS